MPYNLAKRQTDRNIAKAGKSLAQIEDINDVVDRIEKIDFKQNSDEKRGLYNKLNNIYTKNIILFISL